MFDRSLIESAKRKKSPDSALTTLISLGLHAAFVIVVGFALVTKAAPDVIQQPIRAFLVGSGNDPAPPPPPPPPPPGGGSPATTVREPEPEPVTTRDSFIAPVEVPEDLPEPDVPASTSTGDGGQPGGVEGGVEGGEIGGVVGGVIGGVVGGTLGGRLGGTLGGTGTGTGPYRPGGNVLAPKIVYQVDPEYTEEARKARLQGIVIIEAIIDTNGNVTSARVLKGMAGGLDRSALAAVEQWRFKPGTMDGKPVPVIFDLMVRFRLQ